MNAQRTTPQKKADDAQPLSNVPLWSSTLSLVSTTWFLAMERSEARGVSVSRSNEPGWVKIGITCSAGRRSLWFRENYKLGRPEILSNDPNVGVYIYWADIESFELCAGREGDDEHVKVSNDDSKLAYELWSVLCAARFAAET